MPHVVYLRAAHAVDDVDHHRLRYVPQRALRVIPAHDRLVHQAERSPGSNHAKNRTRSANRLQVQRIDWSTSWPLLVVGSVHACTDVCM